MNFATNFRLVLVSVFISVCLCIPGYYPKPSSRTPNVHDEGCYAARTRAARVSLFYPHIHVPTCVEGGLFQHYQCRFGYPCFCAFIDTGNSFPVITPASALYYRFFRFAKFAEQACPVQEQRDNSLIDCRRPPLNYPCDLNLTKYTFNRNTQSCDETTGCYGYRNRSDCEARCAVQVYGACNLPLDEGRVCAHKEEGTRYRHDPSTGRCQSFRYLGCGGNTNNYADMWECQRACVTQVNVTVIVRRGSLTYNLTLPQWVVDRYQLALNETNDLDSAQFTEIGEYVVHFTVIADEDHDDNRSLEIFGNVDSEGKPEEQVMREVFPSHLVCSQPPKTGDCRAFFPRWYYDPVGDQCRKFVFGGCQPNGNNFIKVEECTRYCQAANTPSPLELTLGPTDANGRAIPIPDQLNMRCELVRGEQICYIPTDAPPTTTPSVDDEEDESSAAGDD